LNGRNEVRWGILGAGHVAHDFALDIARRAGNRVETIASRDQTRAAHLREMVGAPRTSPSYQALLEDPAVDVVYVATVNSVHRRHALWALEAGKHVVVEKPLAMDAAQAREIADRAAAAGRFCMEGMWMRMHPLIRRAQSLVRSGAIGNLLGVRAELSTAHPYAPADRIFDPAAGGGALLDLGIYPAHFAWLLLGAPDGIAATMTWAASGADDGVAMQWAYPEGTFAQLYAGFRGPSALGGILSGSSGTLHLGPRLNRPSELTLQADYSDPVTETAYSPGNGFGFEIAEVERCIRAGLAESPLAPLSDTIGVLAALDRVRQESLAQPDPARTSMTGTACPVRDYEGQAGPELIPGRI
jgi:predicted dehydrogenase